MDLLDVDKRRLTFTSHNMRKLLILLACVSLLSCKHTKTLTEYKETLRIDTIKTEKIVEKFKAEREKYNYYMNNLPEVDALLKVGAEKAALVANGVLGRVREKLGFEAI